MTIGLHDLNFESKVYPVFNYQIFIFMQEIASTDKLQMFNMVKKNLEENKELDLFHKAFLKPTDICLKTRYTEKDASKPLNALPYGLKQVCKKQISMDQYQLHDYKPFSSLENEQLTYKKVADQHCDNLLSLLKGQELQLGICICMYSEEKEMLNRTLSGVRENISTFVQNGVRPDKIAVCVVMDGIQVIDESMLGFFEQLEKENNIYVNVEEQPIKPKELLEDEFDDFEIKNLNQFLFSKNELQQRKKRMFNERYREYKEMKNLIYRVEELEKSRILTYDMLQPLMQPIFLSIATEKRKQEFAEDDVEVEKLGKQFLIKEYGSNKPLLWEVLIESKRFCYKYFRSRENHAFFSYYRSDIPLPSINPRNSESLQLGGMEESMRNINQSAYLADEEKNSVKMNLFFITKYKNSGKLSSHNWFFNGFCQELQFKYTILLDVGLCPEKKALYRMYKAMVDDEKVGGVCGYMGIRIERVEKEEEIDPEALDCLSSFCKYFFDIQRAQQMEYHLSHLVDKPFEATFNFIHVLPGAFSGYRMKALYNKIDENQDSTLLQNYFKSLDESVSRSQLKIESVSACRTVMKVLLPDFLYNCCSRNSGEEEMRTDWQVLEESNVYLAEDRTLCLGIHQNGYNLKYIPNSHAWVDPMKTLHGLFGQRKRWINGSYFAFEMVKKEIGKGQGNCCLYPQIMIMQLLNSLAFISPALFLFTISIVMKTIELEVVKFLISGLLNQGAVTDVTESVSRFFTYTINFIYTLFILGLVLYSMYVNTKNRRFLSYIYLLSTIFGILSLIVFIVLLVDLIRGLGGASEFLLNINLQEEIPGGQSTIDSLRYVILVSMCFYVLPVLFYSIFYKRFSNIVQIVMGTLSFIFYAPTYLNILSVYALCRIDDFSWGTKGLLSQDENKKNVEVKNAWKTIKIIYVAKFVFWNVLMGAIFITLSNGYTTRFFFTYVFLGLIGLFLIIKIIIGVIYLIKESCRDYGPVGDVDKTDITNEYFNLLRKSLYSEVQNNTFNLADENKLKFRMIKLIGARKKGQKKFRKER